jgi:hypothetical protein
MGAPLGPRIAEAMPPRHELSLTPFLQPTAYIPEVSSVAGLLVRHLQIEHVARRRPKPYVVHRWVPAARRLSERTVTTQLPGMALPFPPHPSAHRLNRTLYARVPAHEFGMPRGERRRQDGRAGSPCVPYVPFHANPVPLPCFCSVQVIWLKPIYHVEKASLNVRQAHFGLLKWLSLYLLPLAHSKERASRFLRCPAFIAPMHFSVPTAREAPGPTNSST